MSERAQRSLMSFMSSSFKTLAILVISFISTPLLLRFIGPEKFGTFKVLTEIQSYLGLVEMGLLGGIVSNMFTLIHNKNDQGLHDLLSEGKRSYYKVSVFTLIAGLCLLPFLVKLTSWPFQTNLDLYITFILMLLTSLFLPTNIYKGYLDANNRGYVVHIIGFIQSLAFTVIGLSLAYYGWEMKSQGMALLFSGLVGAFLISKKSGIKVSLKPQNKEIKKKISDHQKPQVLNELAGKLCFNLDQIVLSIILGPMAVTNIFLGQRLVQLMQQQIVSLGQSFWASLGSLYYEENGGQQRFVVRLLELSKIIALTAVIGLVPICVLNKAFLQLWVGDVYLPEKALLIVYISALNAFFMGLFSFWGFLLTILGRAHEITKQFYYQAVINIVVSVVATYNLGILGPLIGTLTSFILIPSWYYPKILNKNFSISPWALIKTIYTPLLFGAGMVYLFINLPIQITNLNWLRFLITGTIIFVINFLVIFFLLFNTQEKKSLINKVTKLLGHIRGKP